MRSHRGLPPFGVMTLHHLQRRWIYLCEDSLVTAGGPCLASPEHVYVGKKAGNTTLPGIHGGQTHKMLTPGPFPIHKHAVWFIPRYSRGWPLLYGFVTTDRRIKPVLWNVRGAGGVNPFEMCVPHMTYSEHLNVGGVQHGWRVESAEEFIVEKRIASNARDSCLRATFGLFA